MGIKGTVRRGTDGHLIHANIDTDIIVRYATSVLTKVLLTRQTSGTCQKCCSLASDHTTALATKRMQHRQVLWRLPCP